MATRKDRTEYTEEVKETILEAYHVTGSPADIQKATGIPDSTVSSWVKKEKEEGVNSPSSKDTSPSHKDICPSSKDSVHPVETSSIDDSLKQLRIEKKKVIITKAFDIISEAMDMLREKMQSAPYKDIAVSIGILSEKALLMSGEATARSESIHSVDREELLKAAQEVGDKVKVLPKTQKKAV